MCRLVFSMVEFLFTLDNCPKQNLLLFLLEGLVNPSIITEWLLAWYTSPTLEFSS